MNIRHAARLSLAVSLAFCTLPITGCEAPPRTPSSPGQDPVRAYPAAVIEPALQKFVVIDYTRIIFDAASTEKPMAVTVPARSTADNPFFIQYEFRWFDQQGREQGTSGWKFETMEPGQERMLSANALDSRATAWRLEIRSAR